MKGRRYRYTKSREATRLDRDRLQRNIDLDLRRRRSNGRRIAVPCRDLSAGTPRPSLRRGACKPVNFL